MSALLANVAIAAAIVLSGLSLLLLAIGLVSYFRLRHTRLLWVGVAFLLMALQGVVLSVYAYQHRGAIAAGEASFTSLTFVNLGIVLALYLAVLKR